MSLLSGASPFGSHDLSSQQLGVPVTRRTTHEDEPETTQGMHRTTSHTAHHRRASASLDKGTPAREAAEETGERAEVSEKEPPPHDGSSQTRAASREGDAGSDKGGKPPIKSGKGAPAEGDGEVSTDTEDDADSELERRNSVVQALARSYTNASAVTATVRGQNPFIVGSTDPDSPLNPNGKHFRAGTWAKTVVDLVNSHGGRMRTSGVCFQNLNVYGFGTPTDYQKTVFSTWLQTASLARRATGNRGTKIDILRGFDGVVRSGEMLVVLGPPGSGCSTLLKTIAGETNGIYVDEGSYFNYQGMTAKEMHTHHRGEAIYTAEVDTHFPQLSVGDTLSFAAHARSPRNLPQGVPRMLFADHIRDVVMAVFGISHTINTRVGNEYVRGVSGGERKRVTISEAALSGAPLQCWDNSTRGLDSANAIEFCKTLRMESDLFSTTSVVSIYQAPQSAYDLFDKAVVLYEGYQIYFGNAVQAKKYFINLGFECPARQTTPDFLTSMTSPQERIIRAGFEDKAPRTPVEFAAAWKKSAEYAALQKDIEEYKSTHPFNGPDAVAFRESRQQQQAKGQRAKSPFTLSFGQQVWLCLWRGWKRLAGDPAIAVGSMIANAITALIVASMFYNMQMTTASFFQRGALLFFACLMNAFSAALEILTLYAQRPIVEKHDRYALYHPSAEAVASMLCDMPYKILNSIAFNLTLYFMTNLRREPGAFFFYYLIMFAATLAMSMMFRTIAAMSRTLSQAMVPAALLILILVIFTGFVIPIDYMLPWCGWLRHINFLSYAFESLMVNEFSGRVFTCTASQYVPNPAVPGYLDIGNGTRICSAVGAVAGSDSVLGDDYIASAFRYYAVNKWRNFGIICAFIIFLMGTYLVATEYISEKKSKGEVLVFRRGQKPAALKEKALDMESAAAGTAPSGIVAERDASDKEGGAGFIQRQTSTFHWRDVCYDVKIKSEDRRILDHVDGWVKPGSLTALMGVSGAGKTTLLDCLADRTSMGVISGSMLVDGHHRDASFQRKTGYVQQQDLHLQTTTVREALNFSALLRQPDHIPREEKLAYVDEVIRLLDMEEYANAIIGVPGEGLNVEQRKRLTIGVELAAKPPLLLFVDEPTSGLDSQTSWAILDLLEKLTKSGQAILCTIHQPSAMLFQRFDRLLFLAKGGKTVYFGDIGENSQVLTSYFERNGGHPCPAEANPAEWMLEVIGATPGSETDIDWYETWRNSPECAEVHRELTQLEEHPKEDNPLANDPASYREFAAPFGKQLVEVVHRVFQQYWRTPNYIYSKMAICLVVALFIGFVFYDAPNTSQGLQNQMFAVFNILTIFGQLVQQTMPHFVIQRDLYEVRERPSKVYSWKVFMIAQIVVELPWNTLAAVLMFFSFYYPVGLYRNAVPTGAVTERGALVFLFIWGFLIFTSTFTDMAIAGVQTAEGGAAVAQLLFSMSLLFCGVLAGPDTLPRFWIFMYRVSPFTYIVSGILSSALANTEVVCAANELLHFNPPSGAQCGAYMETYVAFVGGQVTNPNATMDCAYCPIRSTNVFLKAINADYDDRWRNFGIIWAYCFFNAGAALFIYWLARVPKNKNKGDKKEKKKA